MVSRIPHKNDFTKQITIIKIAVETVSSGRFDFILNRKVEHAISKAGTTKSLKNKLNM